LTVATFFTLFFVPCLYAVVYSRRAARQKDHAQDEQPQEDPA